MFFLIAINASQKFANIGQVQSRELLVPAPCGYKLGRNPDWIFLA